MRIVNWSTLPALLGSLGVGLIARMYFVEATNIEPLGVVGILIVTFALGLLARVRKKSWIYTHVKILILMFFAMVLFELSFWSITPLWFIVGFMLSFYVGAVMVAVFGTRRGEKKYSAAQDDDGDDGAGESGC